MGITLIAIVITIIILLILSGIVIAQLRTTGIFQKSKLAEEKTEQASAKEDVIVKIMEYTTYAIQKNETVTLEGLKEYFKDDEEIEDITLYYPIQASLTENLQTTVNGRALYGKIKLLKYKCVFTLNEKIEIVEIYNIAIEKDNNNNNDSDDSNNTDNIEPDIYDGIGDIDSIPSNIINEPNEQYDLIDNIFKYSNGARVTYVTEAYRVSATAINNGYTGNNSVVGNNTEAFWLNSNTWNVQGCLENDDSIENIKYNHNEDAKDSSSSTCMSGSEKKIIIIDPRAYYGDTQSHTYEIDELYMASANSDGDVGKYSIYISNGEQSVTTNPNDSSWNLVTSGELTENGKMINVYNGNLQFKYIKIELYARDCGYMELAAIKGFKKYANENEIKTAAKREKNMVNIIAASGNLGIEKIIIEDPDKEITEQTVNYYKNYRFAVPIYKEGTYKVTVMTKDGQNTSSIEFTILSIEQNIYEYTGNLFNYNQGTRVTYVTESYRTSATAINNGYTGNTGPIGNIKDAFWLTNNSWGVQGCIENDDSKTSLNYNHNGITKNGSSSTCMTGTNTVKQTIIISPRAYQGDLINYIFKTNEIYMASANSDGDVGKFEIYTSISNKNLCTNPEDESWSLLTSGELTEDWNLTKVYDGDVNFRYLKLTVYSRSKEYMELAAIKVFGD